MPPCAKEKIFVVSKALHLPEMLSSSTWFSDLCWLYDFSYLKAVL